MHVAGVECRRHPDHRVEDHMLFVFGDSFVDAGNLPRSAKSRTSRGWYYPYGSSDSAHRNAATGRLSDGLVQSDFLGTYVAYILASSSSSSDPIRRAINLHARSMRACVLSSSERII
jgi:hypothetical protein